MSAFKDQACARARHRAEDGSSSITGKHSGRFAFLPKGSRKIPLTTCVAAALLCLASLGQTISPGFAEPASQSSVKASEAPGHSKESIATSNPLETATPSPEPTPASTPDAETASALAPVAAIQPAAESAPSPTTSDANYLASTSSPMPLGVAGNWSMTFSDEFNGSTLDTSKWSNCWFSPGCGEMNNTFTSPNNVAVANGNVALRLDSSTSGALISTNPNGGASTGYQFTTGYVEARIQFAGNGSEIYNWPAWWTSGQSWPTNNEIDIAEGKGELTSNYMNSAEDWQTFEPAGTWDNSWHVFGMRRSEATTDIFIDGELVKTFASENPAANPHYLILNVGSGRGPAAYGAASEMKVDYVRAWA